MECGLVLVLSDTGGDPVVGSGGDGVGWVSPAVVDALVDVVD